MWTNQNWTRGFHLQHAPNIEGSWDDANYSKDFHKLTRLDIVPPRDLDECSQDIVLPRGTYRIKLTSS